MALPYKIATLLYCFHERGDVLLLERAQEPNRGLWSPCGGKLHTDIGESPYACACREAHEELSCPSHPPICIWPDSSANTATRDKPIGSCFSLR